MGSVTIANGGVFPNIHQTMLPKKAGKGKGDIGFASGILVSLRVCSW